MATTVLQHQQPRIRRLNRNIKDNDASHQQNESVVSLAEFVRQNKLPSIVRVVSGRFADIGCGPHDADAEIYVHSTSRKLAGSATRKSTVKNSQSVAIVFAEVMRFSSAVRGRHSSPPWQAPGRSADTSSGAVVRRLVATGRTVCLPTNGIEVAGCWFELLSEDGQGAPPIKSVEELARRALKPPVGPLATFSGLRTRYLVRQTVLASVGSPSSIAVAIKPGETLTPVRLVTTTLEGSNNFSGDNRNHRPTRSGQHRLTQLQCQDGFRRSVFLSVDQPGLFNPIADNDEFPEAVLPNGVGIVYDGIRSVISAYRLPVTVRIVAGRLSIPDSIGVSSSQSTIFRLTSVSQMNNEDDDNKIPASKLDKPDHYSNCSDENDDVLVYVMSLRHAWSYGSVLTSSAPTLHTNDEEQEEGWKTPLIAVPNSAAQSLAVVAASRDFHVSWLTTDDGRELARRCDRIVGRLHNMVDEISDNEKNPRCLQSSAHDNNGNDHVRWNAPKRQMSVDSGLASSAINDDLYDEIDHIYCMIRYGPGGLPMLVDHADAIRRQRVTSNEKSGGGQMAGYRVEAIGNGLKARNVAAGHNKRPINELRSQVKGADSTPHRQPVVSKNGLTTPAAIPGTSSAAVRSRVISNGHGRTPQQPSSRSNSRPPSRCDYSPIEAVVRTDENKPQNGDSIGNGRFKPITSMIAFDDDDDDDDYNPPPQRFDETSNRKSAAGSIEHLPSAVVYPIPFEMPNVGDGMMSDVDRESGNATGADLTTTSGESFQQRKHARRQSEPSTAAMPAAAAVIDNIEHKPTPMSKNRTRSTNDEHKFPHDPDDDAGLGKRQVFRALSGSNEADSNDRKNRKPLAFVSAITGALRRVGKRGTGNMAFGGTAVEPELMLQNAPDKNKERQGKDKKKAKKNEKDRKSTTWYAIDIDADDNNNDNVEVFDFDIGDGRPNVDVRREWYDTARSRRSWAAPTSGEFDGVRSARRWRNRSRDPFNTRASSIIFDDVIVQTSVMKRPKSPGNVFNGFRAVHSGFQRDDNFGVNVRGQYRSVGQY